MRIMIMRHGEAAMHAPSDAARPLTHNGRQHSIAAANWLKVKLPEMQQNGIDRVLVSPYLRARQTLEAVLTVFSTQDTEILTDLTPGGNEERVADYLRVMAEQDIRSVLVVSHLPLVGYLVADLCPDAGVPMFATSAVVGLTFDPARHKADVNWHYHG